MSAILPQVKKKRTDLLGKNNKDVCLMEKILNVFNMVFKKKCFFPISSSYVLIMYEFKLKMLNFHNKLQMD